jgi:5-methylcytosine-specific restriction protein A
MPIIRHQPKRVQTAIVHAPPRLSSTERGYGGGWRKLRERFAMSHPAICSNPACGAALESSKMHLDHKTPRSRGGTDDDDNLQWLCESCHSAKTATEDGGFGHAR